MSQTDWRPAQLSKIKLAVGRMAERIHHEQVSDETWSKPLVSPSKTPIILPYVTFYKEFRLQCRCRSHLLLLRSRSRRRGLRLLPSLLGLSRLVGRLRSSKSLVRFFTVFVIQLFGFLIAVGLLSYDFFTFNCTSLGASLSAFLARSSSERASLTSLIQRRTSSSSSDWTLTATARLQ